MFESFIVLDQAIEIWLGEKVGLPEFHSSFESFTPFQRFKVAVGEQCPAVTATIAVSSFPAAPCFLRIKTFLAAGSTLSVSHAHKFYQRETKPLCHIRNVCKGGRKVGAQKQKHGFVGMTIFLGHGPFLWERKGRGKVMFAYTKIQIFRSKLLVAVSFVPLPLLLS
jgi:hypothetical protein